MTKKSAASIKATKPKEEVDPRLNFKKYKEIELEVLKTKRILCDRVDTGVDLREYYRNFFGETPDFAEVKKMHTMVVNIVERMQTVVEGFEFEDFTKEVIKDPYASLLKNMDDIDTEKELFSASIAFNLVRPFAERILRVHELVLNDCEAAGIEVTKDAED